MDMVKSGTILERNGALYEVICADSKVFVIASTANGCTKYEDLEAYSNDETVLSLCELGFTAIVGREKYGL